MSTQNEPVNGKGQIGKPQKMNNALGIPFVAIDSYMRIKEGESAPVAVGKALLTNAAFGLIPGGLVGGVAAMAGYAAIQAGPEIARAIDQQKATLNQQRSQFGGNFQSTEAQMMMQQQGYNQMINARQQLVSQMANHARGAQRVY